MAVTASNATFTVSEIRTGLKCSWVSSSTGFLTKTSDTETSHVLATAAQPLKMIHPRPRSQIASITSMWTKWTSEAPWKAYPSAIGGVSPYIWSLVNAPSGMTIATPVLTDNSTYANRAAHGRITWASPTVGDHTFIVRCTDQLGNSVTESVTLNIATSNAIWVSPSGTDSAVATGSKAAPYQKIDNFYADTSGTLLASDTRNQNKIVIFRAGTYTVPVDSGGSNLNLGSNKPCVWAAYDEESVILDCVSSGLRWANSNGAGSQSTVELIGLTTYRQNNSAPTSSPNAFQVFAAMPSDLYSDATVSGHLIVCDHLSDSYTHEGSSGADNPSALRLSATDPGANQFRRRHQMRNIRFTNVGGSGTTSGANTCCILPMSLEHSEVNNCYLESQNFGIDVVVKLKHHVRNITVRYCNLIATVAENRAMGAQGGGNVSAPGAIIEIEYCCFAMPASGTSFGIASGTANEGDYGTTYVRRCTFFGTPPEMLQFDEAVGTNAVVRGANIIEASASWQDHADWTGRITNYATDHQAASGVVDAEGKLEGSARTSYLGVKGWEIA